MDNQILTAAPEPQTCPAVGYQSVSVCAPVTVAPFAKPGQTVTTCCGNPVVQPGNKPCGGVKNGVCAFTITQTLCIKVPVVFGANTDVGDPFVDCKGASNANICLNCGKMNEDEDEDEDCDDDDEDDDDDENNQ